MGPFELIQVVVDGDCTYVPVCAVVCYGSISPKKNRKLKVYKVLRSSGQWLGSIPRWLGINVCERT